MKLSRRRKIARAAARYMIWKCYILLNAIYNSWPSLSQARSRKTSARISETVV